MTRYALARAAALTVAILALGSPADAKSNAATTTCHTKKVSANGCTAKKPKILKSTSDKDNPTQEPIGRSKPPKPKD